MFKMSGMWAYAGGATPNARKRAMCFAVFDLPQDLRQIEQGDDFFNRHFLAIPFWRPAKEAKVIAHRLRQETLLPISRQRGAFIALAHLAAIDVQDERNVGIRVNTYPKPRE